MPWMATQSAFQITTRLAGDGDVISDDDAVHKVQETLWRLPQKQPR